MADPLEFHRENHGKIEVDGKVSLESGEDLGLAYTPGVAEPTREIAEDSEKVYDYTVKGGMAAVASNGTSVLGLGDVGAEAAIPVMEGKALLIRELSGVSAFPLVVDEEDPEEFTDAVERLSPMYGFMMLEDIESPACFQVEEELKERLEIPVFHDDQHGAAIAVLAGLKNAFEVVGKEIEEASITVVGAGAAGIATADLLLEAGVEDVKLVDKPGILAPGMDETNEYQNRLAERTNPGGETGSLEDALKGSDALVGLSTGGIVSKEMVKSMAEDPVVFALANPEPEIMPGEAREAGAAVVGTGRSDFPNQINNVLAFPGVVKGTLGCNAFEINTEMKLAATDAIAGAVEPRRDRVVPSPLDPEVTERVADAVKETGRETGACRI